VAEDPKDKAAADPDATILSPAATTPDDEATVFTPPPPGTVAPAAGPAPGATVAPAAGPPPGGGKTGQIEVGSLLNGIYEVKRFIARGGMGEVYEGVNVNTEERVAIKVILQHLAADPTVRQMFLREAQTLTKLGHPALVAYRLAAQEPTLGVFYIVTEFVDGKSLADLLGKAFAGEEMLVSLTKRLAEGLRAAHEFKVYHRDMSPDNVLCPGGRLEDAKVIDFGIAKDAGASSATIIGDGFAGKLNYVAPEQFGDYGREIGPWTDIYSLALIILAVANGKTVPMGTTLIEAIEKRRLGVDLSIVPERLRPVLAKMLEPDPKNRYRDMDEVVAALAEVGGRRAADATQYEPTVMLPQGGMAPAGRAAEPAPAPAKPAGGNRGLLIGGGVGAVALIGAAAFLVPQLMKPKAQPGDAAAVVERVLPTLACSWIEVTDVKESGGGVQVTLTGASKDPAGAASTIAGALRDAKIGSVNTDTTGVSPLAPEACATVDAFRQFRAAASVGRWVTPQAREFHFKPTPACGNDPKQALAVIEVDKPPGGSDDIALVGMEASGKAQVLFSSMDDFHKLKSVVPPGTFVEQPQKLQLNLCNDKPVATGVLVIRGASPIDLGLPTITQDATIPPADFAQKFSSMAKSKGWRTQMAWYRVVEN
jgi:hypothetical protein